GATRRSLNVFSFSLRFRSVFLFSLGLLVFTTSASSSAAGPVAGVFFDGEQRRDLPVVDHLELELQVLDGPLAQLQPLLHSALLGWCGAGGRGKPGRIRSGRNNEPR